MILQTSASMFPKKVLLRDGKTVTLTPKLFDTLEIFLENAGLLLEKDELMQKIWHDHFVEESNLTSNIKMLRKALGDNPAKPQFIETVPRRGYRFIAEVRETFKENSVNNGAGRMYSAPEEENARRPSIKFMLPMLVVLIVGVIFIGFWFAKSKNLQPFAQVLSAPFASEKLSTNGKVFYAVISPDGRTVVYTDGLGSDKQSVWLRQLASSNNVQIIPPSDEIYFGLALSPDGNFLYFVRRPRSFEGQGDIYRIPIFGGIPQKIVSETQGNVSISPDGEKISFRRCFYREDEYCSLWIADADGKNERKLVSRPRPIRISDNQFSPDGRSVVFAVGQSENAGNDFGLSEVDIESGQEHELTRQKFFDIKHLAWLPDGSGLLFTASQIPNKNFRIWQISASSGEVQPLTNDSESYSALSLDKTGSLLVSTQFKQNFRLRLLNTENTAAAPRILADATNITFAPNNKIIFSSMMSGNDEIWSINADGSGRQQLTNDAADDRHPVASTDNNWIFFASNRTGEVQVWRMNMDGSNQTQITAKEGGFPLFVSVEGKWIYYHHGITRTLWRASTAGDTEQIVLNQKKYRFALSPDGSQAAFAENPNGENLLVIVSLADQRIIKTFKLADPQARLIELKFSPDGKNLAYILADNKTEENTLWFQPLSPESARRIAELGNEGVANAGFAIAPDGKNFIVAQGGWRHDAVLLKGLK